MSKIKENQNNEQHDINEIKASQREVKTKLSKIEYMLENIQKDIVPYTMFDDFVKNAVSNSILDWGYYFIVMVCALVVSSGIGVTIVLILRHLNVIHKIC